MVNKLKEFIDEHRNQVWLGLVIVVVILALAVAMLWSGHGSSGMGMSSVDSSTGPASSYSRSGPSHAQEQRAYVDVEGDVKRPGVYQFDNNMRIVDAINLAGGMKRSADRKRLNLAQKLTDQQVVYVPAKGEKGIPNSAKATGGDSNHGNSGGDGSSSSSRSGQININQADPNKLKTIRGFGDKRAAKIVDYRKSHGDFKSIDDIKKISGIGPKIFDNIKGQITV